MIKTDPQIEKRVIEHSVTSQTSHTKPSGHIQQVNNSKPVYSIMYRPMRREPAAATGTLSEPAPLAKTTVSEGVADEEELATVEVPLSRTVLVTNTETLL